MPSPYIEREATIVRMTVALKKLSPIDLNHTLRRAGVYARAGVDTQDIGRYDAIAFDRETLRRTRLAPVYAARDAMAGCFMFASLVALYCCIPDDAQAASDIIAQPTDWSDSFLHAILIIAGLGLVGAFVWAVFRVAAFLIYPRRTDSYDAGCDMRNLDWRAREAEGSE